MRFLNAQTVKNLAHFTEMRLRSVPDVVIKLEKWNPALDVAWFRITNIPFEKISYSNVCMVASKVGLPMEVGKDNLHKNDYVRVKIGCRDVTKVPTSVDGLLDFQFYDYFSRGRCLRKATLTLLGLNGSEMREISQKMVLLLLKSREWINPRILVSPLKLVPVTMLMGVKGSRLMLNVLKM